MPNNQDSRADLSPLRELAVRTETAEVLCDLFSEDGSRGSLPDRYYHQVSHWMAGDRANVLEGVVWMLLELPEEEEGRLNAYLQSIHITRRAARKLPNGKILRLREQEHDNEEDMAGLLAAEDEDASDHLHLDRLLRHRAAADDLIAHYRRRIAARERKPPRHAAGSVAAQRRAS